MELAVWKQSLVFVCCLTLTSQGVSGRHNKNARKSLPAMVKYSAEMYTAISCVSLHSINHFGTENFNTSSTFIMHFKYTTTEYYGHLNENSV
jgi:hypothetical protein